MKSFLQFVLEYPISDIRYFKALPDVKPPTVIKDILKRYNIVDSHWKIIHNRAFNRSRELDNDIVVMIPNDIEENWVHEAGHLVFDHSNKNKIKPVLDKIRDEYGMSSDGLKWVELGGYDYSYSHSGKDYEYDELFAISFAFYEGDKKKFDDPALDKEFSAVLKNLQDEPLFNSDPYISHDDIV